MELENEPQLDMCPKMNWLPDQSTRHAAFVRNGGSDPSKTVPGIGELAVAHFHE